MDLRVTLEPFRDLDSSLCSKIENIVVLGSKDNGLFELACSLTKVDNVCFDNATGPFQAMNLGAQLATGKYLWFLNAGDMPHLSHLYDALLHAASSEAAIHAYGCLMKNGPNESIWQPLMSDLPLGTFPHPSLLFKRDQFSLLGGFSTKYKYTADRLLLLHAYFSACSMRIFSLTLATYVSSPDALSSTSNAAFEDIVLTLSVGLFPRISSIVDYIRKSLSTIIYRLFNNCCVFSRILIARLVRPL